MSTALNLQRRDLPAVGSPYFYHQQNANIEAINKTMEEANLTEDQRKTVVANITELVRNSVRDGIDQQEI